MSNLLKKMSNSLIRSFLVSEMSDSLTSLISSERPERFAHGRSFVLSDLSESLTVAHLIWAKWVNEQMSNEQISEFPALEKTVYNIYPAQN